MTALLDRLPWQRQDALPLAGQLLAVPAGRYDWIYLALAGAQRLDETVWLHYGGGVDQEYLRSLAADPPFRPASVVARVGVPRRDRLVALRLPDRSDLRVLAIAYLPATAHTTADTALDPTTGGIG